MIIHPYPSPNHDDRRDGARPSYLVIHDTECDRETALSLLTDGRSQNPVSAHYLIDRSGYMLNLVPDDRRAWHCGDSAFGAITDMNSHTIGIELVNDGASPYPQAQMTALILLVRHLMARHGIAPKNIVGHRDIAPHRKRDPGLHFDWPLLHRHGIGLMPGADLTPAIPEPMVTETEGEYLDHLLVEWGYNRTYVLTHRTAVIGAFQAHYDPHGPQDGQPYKHHVPLLMALIGLDLSH